MREEKMTTELLNEYRRVAYYYYKVGMTQDAIAKKMQMSRQRVNRIVSACVKFGIVKISIEGLEQSNLELETKLEEKYGLQEVRIIDIVAEETLFRDLGVEAGNCLKSIISDKDIIGVSRGRTTVEMVENLYTPEPRWQDVIITQLIGSSRESELQMRVDNLVYRLADKLGAKAEVQHAPVITASPEIKQAFLKDVSCQVVYEIMKACTIAIVGIGTAHSQWKHMVSLYDKNDAQQIEWAKDVVGEVCTHFYDKNGETVVPPFRDRIMAIDLEDYKKIPLRIGVAGGEQKVDAIRAALVGGYVNALVTDVHTAELL